MTRGHLVLYVATSVDGYLATEDEGVEWLDDFDDGNDGGYEAFFEGVDALVMGARTYEQVRSFGDWPYGDRPTYVLTHRTDAPGVDTVRFVDADVETLGECLRTEYDRVWVVGGAAVAQAFLRVGQVDEVRLSVVPLLLGSGVPLFGDDGRRERLSLVETTTREDGIVELRYRRA